MEKVMTRALSEGGPHRDGTGIDEGAVKARLESLRVDHEARKLFQAQQLPAAEPPQVLRLDEFLETPDIDAEYRIDRLMPTGANVVLAAQFKAGKSTLVGNALGSLSGGGEFLGRFPTVPVRRVVLIDNELDPRTLRRWLREHRIDNPERVDIVSLRGSVSSFNIVDPEVRAEWAERIGEADVLILDCLRPVLDALGMDENRDAGKFLVAFDALKAQAGIDEGILVHHMGHGAERSRGDSRILDWPDVTWRILRESDDPASPRYFSAYGRDVDVKEGLLSFDGTTRGLTYGVGTRKEARDADAIEQVKPAVLSYVIANPGVSGKQIEDAVTGGRRVVREARDELLSAGKLNSRNRAARGGGKAYFAVETRTSPSSPEHRLGPVGTSPTSLGTVSKTVDLGLA